MKTFRGGGGMGPWRTPVYQPWFSKAPGSAGIRVHFWENGASRTHPKLAGMMGCLVLGGGEQMELGKALDRSWKNKLGGFLTPGGLWVPTSTLPQQMQTPTFTAGLFLLPCTPSAAEGWGDALPSLSWDTQAEAIHTAVSCSQCGLCRGREEAQYIIQGMRLLNYLKC